MTTRRSTRLVSLALLLLWTVPALANDDALVVHEWGTFTCLQDENGKGIGGINTDDEPVPDFVHNIVPALLIPVSSDQPLLSKSVPRCHTDVTMRLETPVIYFHPGKDFAGRFNVTVDLNHGWLTQFFPDAQAHAFGINGATVGSLEHYGHGSLEWRNIALGQSEEGPATRSLVWTTPRRVNAATVEVKGEHEKFLFYRGVANLPAPLRVVRSGPELTITKIAPADAAETVADLHQLWLLDVRDDGLAAFRVVLPFEQAPAFVAKTPAKFEAAEYSSGAASQLKNSMRKALVGSGLFEDEADALLDTWQVSYFKSAGLRLFFLVPPKWTDATLPLRIRRWPPQDVEVHPEVTRVMVGRIEITTPEQRALLLKLSRTSAAADLKDPPHHLELEKARFLDLHENYVRLGRFRNALVLDEQHRRPNPELAAFINYFSLHAYVPPRSIY